VKPRKPPPDSRSQLAEVMPGIVADLIDRTRGATTADLCALVGALHDAAKIAESLEVGAQVAAAKAKILARVN
jgi:glycerol-3-phosphate responsive antiterminator